MKLAIVGSTRLAGDPRAAALIERILDCYQPMFLVSGGAPGIDTMAEVAASRRGLGLMIFRPRVQRWDGPGGFRERNLEIVQACDALVRIASRFSLTYGSGWTRDRAKEMGKPTEEYIL